MSLKKKTFLLQSWRKVRTRFCVSIKNKQYLIIIYLIIGLTYSMNQYDSLKSTTSSANPQPAVPQSIHSAPTALRPAQISLPQCKMYCHHSARRRFLKRPQTTIASLQNWYLFFMLFIILFLISSMCFSYLKIFGRIRYFLDKCGGYAWRRQAQRKYSATKSLFGAIWLRK